MSSGCHVFAWSAEKTISLPARQARELLCRRPLPSLHLSLQIISHVQSQSSGSGLAPLPQAELPAGPFLRYQPYIDLMAACWTRDPEQRPKFEDIVQQLRWF